MTSDDHIQRAILELIEDRLDAIRTILGPDRVPNLRDPAIATSTTLAAEIVSDDPRLAAQAARTIMDLWPQDTQPPDWFWAEPLGQLVMLAGNEALSMRQAGWCLGVSKQMVHSLTQRGHLDRHPTLGGVTAESVRAKIGERG